MPQYQKLGICLYVVPIMPLFFVGLSSYQLCRVKNTWSCYQWTLYEGCNSSLPHIILIPGRSSYNKHYWVTLCIMHSMTLQSLIKTSWCHYIFRNLQFLRFHSKHFTPCYSFRSLHAYQSQSSETQQAFSIVCDLGKLAPPMWRRQISNWNYNCHTFRNVSLNSLMTTNK